MSEKPIGVDLFCGAGGMSLGFRAAGFSVRTSVDYEPIHTSTYRRNFPKTNVLTADLSKVSGRKLRDFSGLEKTEIDVLFGGPPCQGFSSMGKNDAKDGRNRLLLEFARIAKELRPKFLVIENVQGLLFSTHRKILDKLLLSLESAGFEVNDEIRALNAREFGVPQSRKRVFIIAARRGLSVPEYPDASCDYVTVKEAIRGLPNIDNYQYLLESDTYFGKVNSDTEYASKLNRALSISGLGRESKLGLGGCMRTVHSRQTIRRFEDTPPGEREEISRFFRLDPNGFSPTLRAGTGVANGSYTAPRPIHPFHPRCISVREGARLHSFPDWFNFHPTKWHGFRQVGNSVPPLLAKAVARSVMRSIQK